MRSMMENNEDPVSALGGRYAEFLENRQVRGETPGELFSLYNKDNLKDPPVWYQALATCEYALDREGASAPLLDLFKLIFRGYDCAASVDLNDTDYDWYWNKIHALLDRLAVADVWAVREKGLQYGTGRREYKDKNLMMEYLGRAAAHDEYSGILYGYYLYTGLGGVQDKARGKQWVEKVSDEKNKFWSILYLGYIALNDDDRAEAARIAGEIVTEGLPEKELMAALEFQGTVAVMQQETDLAYACFTRLLDLSYVNVLALFQLGILHLKGRPENSDPQKGLRLLEDAYRFGRYDAANTLAYCYNPETGNPWGDFGVFHSWLEKGFLYGQSYCAFELSSIYLYNEEHKDVAKGLFCLDYAVEQEVEDALLRKAYLYFEGKVVEKNRTKALELLKQAMDGGSGYAAYRIGFLYEQGEVNGEPEHKTALEFYEKSAELGHPYGCDLAGRSYRYGYAGETDWQKAKAYFEKGIDLNSSFSAVELAFMYEAGEGVETNLDKAYELYRKGAEKDYPYAMLRVGIYEENGTLGKERPGEAFAWYKKSAEAGNAEAMFRVARCYKYAIGTEENPDKAIEWLRKGAEEEEPHCLTELALCYEYAYGVEEDAGKAAGYYSQAAAQEYGYAQYKLGTFYMNGYGPVEEDHDKAFEWYEKAVQNGNAQALVELGDYYLYDYDGLKQYDKAFAYYKKALDDDLVTEGLGYCLFYGYGVESNEAEAFKYFLMAAERGYVRAMYRAGLAYYYGWGIKENKEEAFRWFNDAAGNEMNAARYYTGKMLLEGEGCTADVETGILWLKQAAEEDDSDAQYEMGNCCLLGRGVEENPDTAWEWFEKAAANGHEQALKVVGRRKRK